MAFPAQVVGNGEDGGTAGGSLALLIPIYSSFLNNNSSPTA